MTAPNPDPLQAAEDVPPFRRRPSDEEVALLRDIVTAAVSDAPGKTWTYAPRDWPEPRPVLGYVIWAVSLLLAALAGALVALWTVGRLL